MADKRDFLISFNVADLAYAEAIDAALRMAGSSIYFHPRDLKPGGNIAIWIDDALTNSAQTLALYSPSYVADGAVYSRAERYATWWQDPGSDKRKLIPILLAETQLSPLMAPIKHIDVCGMTAPDAAAAVVAQLNAPDEMEKRDVWRRAQPLPAILNAAYRPNPNFAGRLDALESLHRSLKGSHAVVAAVAGMGGIGKTTLAAEYCHRFGGLYAGVWWVRADREATITADLADLGQRLGLKQSGNLERDARACIARLATAAAPWLVVFDNAPNADAIAGWLPVGSTRCLITSRRTDFDQIAATVRLDEWSNETTANYLLARTGSKDGDGAKRLAGTLGGLPLAAEHAAVFLNSRHGISFDEYTADIVRLLQQPRPDGAQGDYPDTVYAAIRKTLDYLAGMESGDVALALLRLCSFFSPDGIDLSILTMDGGQASFAKPLGDALADKFAREDMLSALRLCSLLSEPDGPAGPILMFHRLVLGVARDLMTLEEQARSCESATRAVLYVFPMEADLKPLYWPSCNRLLPHVLTVQQQAGRLGLASNEMYALLERALGYSGARGNISDFKDLAEYAVTLARRVFGEKSSQTINALNILAAFQAKLGIAERAEANYRAALELAKEMRDDKAIVSVSCNIGNFYIGQKRFAQSEATLQEAMALCEESKIDKGSYLFSILLSTLGQLYMEWHASEGLSLHAAKADDYMRQSLAITLSLFGVRHAATAIKHQNLAIVSAHQGIFSGAVDQALRSVAINASLDIMREPNSRIAFENLIQYLLRKGARETAETLVQGDGTPLVPIVEQIEAEHRAWVAEDPETRHFGPQSPVTGAAE